MAERPNFGDEPIVRRARKLVAEDTLTFIHLDGFTADWSDLKLTDDDLRILQIQIMLSPTAGAVVKGTGGLRKMRFAPPSWRSGKRGALRVLYALFPRYSLAVLAAAFAKKAKEDIRPDERRMLRMILEEIANELAGGQQT